MKLTATRIDLIKAIGAAVRVVERRKTIPVLGNILLSTADGALAIRATDLDMEVSTSCAATVTAPGSTTVPAGMLHDILRKLPEGADVSVELGDILTQATIRSGRSRFTLQTLPATDFPDITTGEMAHSFEIAAADLATMLGEVGFAISTEETRYYLNGIYLHVTDGADGMKLVAVATDGHRLARRTLPAPEGAAGMPGIIVPRKAVAEIVRMLDKLGSQPVTLAMSTQKLKVETPDATLVTKLIDGTFPDYVRVIPAANGKRATVEAATLLGAVDRVATISSERGRAVRLGFADNRLAIDVTDPDSGTARDEIDADYSDEALEIGFNARYLVDILGVLIGAGADTVTLKLDTPGSPTILQARDTADLLIVLMPMRV
jgi:DNA polymerase III subunit beta